MPVDPSTIIDQAITDPASISGDGITVQSRSMDDLLKALNYKAYLLALANNHNFGIRRTQMIPQGPVNLHGPQLDANFNQGII